MSQPKLSSRAFDLSEFGRFIGTGVTATVGNLATVWIVGQRESFGFALLAGSVTGFVVSFLLSKLVAFKAMSWDRAWMEALRFTLVHSAGAAVYWVTGFVIGTYALSGILEPQNAEMGGALIGASLMTLTSYFGHRFYTYRTSTCALSEASTDRRV